VNFVRWKCTERYIVFRSTDENNRLSPKHIGYRESSWLTLFHRSGSLDAATSLKYKGGNNFGEYKFLCQRYSIMILLTFFRAVRNVYFSLSIAYRKATFQNSLPALKIYYFICILYRFSILAVNFRIWPKIQVLVIIYALK